MTRRFASFDSLREQGKHWQETYANLREHGTTRRVPRIYFETDEKKFLRSLNPHPYDCDEILSRVVPPQFLILYETNRYSVPWTLVGMTVTLRIGSDEIKIYYNEQFITVHKRSYKKNETLSIPEHSKGLLERKPGANRDIWQIAAVKNLGPNMAKYLDLLRTGNRSI